jgi:hypothetical protein
LPIEEVDTFSKHHSFILIFFPFILFFSATFIFFTHVHWFYFLHTQNVHLVFSPRPPAGEELNPNFVRGASALQVTGPYTIKEAEEMKGEIAN